MIIGLIWRPTKILFLVVPKVGGGSQDLDTIQNNLCVFTHTPLQ